LNSSKHKNLAIIHKGRCGSTVLGELLGQNPNFDWGGEALETHGIARRWLRRLQGVKGKSFHDDLQALMRRSRNRIYVFSMKGLYQFNSTPQMVEALRRAGFDSFAILERRNILRWVVSAEVGIRHKVWHVHASGAPELRAVHIPLQYDEGESLLDRLQAIQCWYPELRTCLESSPVLNLVYEEHIVPSPRMAYREVCAFMGVDAREVSTNSGVVNPFPLDKMITNFDEVKAHLSGSGFEWMTGE
jgi:hypothetical protein